VNIRRLRSSLVGLLGGLWFVPGGLVVLFGVLAVAAVEIDQRSAVAGSPLFEGDAPAARTVLSVIAGSLITVAGLTLSITIVVLQLTSSQFSPRILRNFFGDRVTQVTVGAYVGIFVYALVVLRSVGGNGGFVPRLSVTVASALAIAAVVLLIVFIHHVSLSIQVSYVTGDIARKTLARLDALYPEGRGEVVDDDTAAEVLASWNAEPHGRVTAGQPGYVLGVDLDGLARALAGRAGQAAVLVRPGDFVSVEMPLVAVWPAGSAEACREAVRTSIRIDRERDLDQDVDFGLRQLVDTAVKALSPGINDPTTACTCIGYIRSILVRLAERPLPAPVRRYPEHGLTILALRREFEEHLEALEEIDRHAGNDPRVTRALVAASRSISDTAQHAGARRRSAAARDLAVAVDRRAATSVTVVPDRRVPAR
jgi:uncharacterized membrane protein